jgi:hypothetical protein
MSGMQARTIATAGSRPERRVASTPVYVMSMKSRPGRSVWRYIVIAQVLRDMSAWVAQENLGGSVYSPYSDAK